MSKGWWLAIAAFGSVSLLIGAVTVFTWMVDETHFDRPDERFDRLTAQVAEVPGVTVDASERWVEAPIFFEPNARIELSVEEASLPALLDAACTSPYRDSVSWSLRVRTEGANVVAVHSDPEDPHGARGERCPDFGLDVTGLIAHVDRAVPGLDLRATVWGRDTLALGTAEDVPDPLHDLLPLVAHAEDLRDAAGLHPDRLVEINAADLILVIRPGEQERYLELLTRLVEEHGVSSYWADGGGTPSDGVEKVQIVAPDQEHDEIEDALRASDLHVADLPVRFIPDNP
ncbi:hypothetical protein CLV46_0254 [Diaminobutyricimonas aerilata]|uniref:Uncharacterized protein n=1 Tax=Diaminobutyricimonas aerilata TaxID=1162967 RepID=A0A2M9CFR7_9MICO|nr:hypothetical protein [Diaminobutyricimonas aerilata]PJJ70729.1 hypothetical protein CLV46_0254 [Diaminobutyricimonas aerilata]